MPSKEKFGDFRDLLNPIKDPQLSFAIDIAEVLQNYVKGFREGRVSPNFNSAALLLQGSSNIYGKKVEFLYNLTSKLCECLLKNKQDAPGKDNHKKDNPSKKEKHLKENLFDDPFFNPEIKRGKNLCCLRQKVTAKDMAAIKRNANKKALQRNSYVPVDLLPMEGEDKGEPFYDTQGEVVGNKKEYVLNRCKITNNGWILLPTVSENLIPAVDAPSDYTCEDISDYDSGMDDYDSDTDAPIPVPSTGEAPSDPDAPMSTLDSREIETAPDTATPTSTPMDEGYPQSSASTVTPDSAPNSQIPSSQGTDEGLGSLPGTPLEGQLQANPDTPMSDLLNGDIASDPIPMEGVEEGLGNLSPGIENIPLDDADVAPKPRRSMRNALKVCQLDGEPTNAAQNQVDMVAIRKLIQKKNTCNLPAKLKGEEILALNPASEFCARAYFGLDENLKQKVCLPTFGVSSFVCNSKIRGKLLQIYDRMLLRREKRGGAPIPVPDGEDNDVDIDRVENLNDPDPDNMFETPNLEAPDIAVENDLVQPIPLISDENPIAEEEPVMNGNDGNDDSYDMIEDSFEAAAKLQCRIFKEELIHYVRTSDIAEKLIEWEKTVKPFLEKLKGRENFDINLYGSRILNSFSDNNRKQTVTFRNFCQGKEKWEIHRYFMALLPLVNVGNVTIETDELSDGDEDILVTLLSRKMHHKELEEFGHGEGEHTS